LEHEEALEAATAKEKGPGGGGIRIVLNGPIADPLLRPGQKPRRCAAVLRYESPFPYLKLALDWTL